jgi:hypothetical protein
VKAASRHAIEWRLALMDRKRWPSLSVGVSHETTIALACKNPSAGRAGWSSRHTGLP